MPIRAFVITVSFDPENNERGPTPNADERMLPLLSRRSLFKTGKTCRHNKYCTSIKGILIGIENFARIKCLESDISIE
jgi:hypothetical protein